MSLCGREFLASIYETAVEGATVYEFQQDEDHILHNCRDIL